MPDRDLDALLDDLRTLVEIESPSRHVAELETSADAVAAMFTRLTGVTPDLVHGPAGPHVHWHGGDDPRVLVVGHHDTVFPLGTLERRPFTLSDGTATGPGVFDMKAGVVMAAHAIASLDEADRGGIEVLITADEEVGSRSSRQLIEERARACGSALVLEASADGGALKTARKGVGMYSVAIGGRAAHAGLEPEKGVNALVEAAHQTLAIDALGAPDRGTTVTATVATAGTAENVVPAEATIKVDVRVTTMDEASRLDQAMGALAPVNPDATVAVSGGVNRPPMTEERSAELFRLATDVAAELGLGAPRGVAVGGGSDGNFTAAVGVPTLDGLGAVGGGAHADHEWVDTASLPERTSLVAGILRRLTSGAA